MALNKKNKDILDKFHSRHEVDDYFYRIDDWWYDDCDESYDPEYDDDVYIYEYSDNDQPIHYQRYIIRRLSVPSTDYKSSGLRPIDMESIYDNQTLRQRKIDQILGLITKAKKPTFGDLFPRSSI